MNHPERYYHVSQTQLSTARHFGCAKINGAFYVYDPKKDELIRDDVLRREAKAAKAKAIEPTEDLFK